MFDTDRYEPAARIKVIGVGGGGGNAINTMVAARLDGVEFIAANTDVQALSANRAPLKLQLGQAASRGLGAGANPEKGREAALEGREAVAEALAGSDMVFVTAGMARRWRRGARDRGRRGRQGPDPRDRGDGRGRAGRGRGADPRRRDAGRG